MNQNTGPNDDEKDPRAARREKLRKIAELGIDPFGSRFDDRTMIGTCRDRAAGTSTFAARPARTPS